MQRRRGQDSCASPRPYTKFLSSPPRAGIQNTTKTEHPPNTLKTTKSMQIGHGSLLGRRRPPDRRPRRAPVRLRVDLVPQHLDVVEQRRRRVRIRGERDLVPVHAAVIVSQQLARSQRERSTTAGPEQPDSPLLLREQRLGRTALLDVLHNDRVRLDPLANDIVHKRPRRVRLDRPGDRVRARDLVPAVQQCGAAGVAWG